VRVLATLPASGLRPPAKQSKSTKAEELAASPLDGWRKTAIAHSSTRRCPRSPCFRQLGQMGFQFPHYFLRLRFKMVGAIGFEPMTSTV
jgi:hypothetical protein